MIHHLQEHYNDEDIIKLNMGSETRRWKEELEFSSRELGFYLNLLSSELITKVGTNSEDSDYLFQQLRFLQETNVKHLQDLGDFEIKLEGMQECDDVQCENYYLKDHMAKKVILEKHLKIIRSLKDYIFISLDEGIQKAR